jgi:HSP20 family protein
VHSINREASETNGNKEESNMRDNNELAISTGTLPESSFVKRMRDVEYAIAHRAYELFASSGFTGGHDVSDWLSAESELLEPVSLNLTETENELTLRAELPGFTEKDIEVRVEPRAVFISGEREDNAHNKEEGGVASSEHNWGKVFRAIDLPVEVDPDKVKATFAEEMLRVILPKKEVGKKVADEEKAH